MDGTKTPLKRGTERRALRLVQPFGVRASILLLLAAVALLGGGALAVGLAFGEVEHQAYCTSPDRCGSYRPEEEAMARVVALSAAAIAALSAGVVAAALGFAGLAHARRGRALRRTHLPLLAEAKAHFASGRLSRPTYEAHRAGIEAAVAGATPGQRLWLAGSILLRCAIAAVLVAILAGVGYAVGTEVADRTDTGAAAVRWFLGATLVLLVGALAAAAVSLLAGLPLHAAGRARTADALAAIQRSEDDVLDEVRQVALAAEAKPRLRAKAKPKPADAAEADAEAPAPVARRGSSL